MLGLLTLGGGSSLFRSPQIVPLKSPPTLADDRDKVPLKYLFFDRSHALFYIGIVWVKSSNTPESRHLASKVTAGPASSTLRYSSRISGNFAIRTCQPCASTESGHCSRACSMYA